MAEVGPAPRAVLVTGASGFVGAALCDALDKAGYQVRRALRRAPGAGRAEFQTGEIDGATDWIPALNGASCVVHLAARTHVLHETAADALAAYRQVNLAGTERLARQAVAAGVRRLVFLSSVKVNGESTSGRPYTEDDRPAPEDAYGMTKWEAEQALGRVAAGSGMEFVILRPPLVYGPRVKGNFLRLTGLVARGVPLPFAALDNRRSLIYLGNLVDAIVHALGAPAAAGRTYLVSDGEDHSTPALVRGLARALGVKARLFTCPVSVLYAGAQLLGRRAEIDRLAGSLQIDDARIRRELGWRPRYTPAQGFAETARWYHLRSGELAPRAA